MYFPEHRTHHEPRGRWEGANQRQSDKAGQSKTRRAKLHSSGPICWSTAGALTIYMEKLEIVVGQSNGLHHTPYSKMAATQDGLGRVARKRGIEGHGTRDPIRSTRQPQGMDRHTANSGKKKAPKQRISLVAYMTSKSQGFSFG